MARSAEARISPEPVHAAARALARDDVATPDRAAPDDLSPRLRAVARCLADVHRRLQETGAAAAGVRPRIAEWLLDNEYLVRGALDEARRGLPRGFLRRLPRLDAGPARGKLRVSRVARALLAESEAELDLDRVARFLEAYQEVRPLTIGELWALPAALRLELTAELASVAARTCDLPGADLGRALPAPGDEARALDRVTDCISSLRLLQEHDWKVLFERVSRVEAILRDDPAGAYGAMDFSSRDRYRNAVEEIGGGVAEAEEEAAGLAVVLSRAAEGSAAEGRAAGEDRAAGEGRAGQDRAAGDRAAARRRKHVGHWLVGGGRRLLEARLGARVPVRVRILRRLRRGATGIYLGAVGALGGAVLAPPVALALESEAGIPLVVAVALAAVAPSLGIAVSVVHWVVVHALPPSVLPKLDFSEGIPDEWRTLVAIPCLITNPEEVEELLDRLRVLHRTGGGPNVRFALLTGHGDAPRREMPGDARLLEAAMRGVRRLNRALGDGEGPFHLLHRERRWNPSEGRWMGWERKRGKLHELNRLLLGAPGAADAFPVRVGEPEWLRGVRFVLTLDADTDLTRDAVSRLAGALAHPLNRPVLGAGGRIVAGYTVLQPGLETFPSGEPTRFARLAEVASGLDLYSHAVSDAYQDLFGEGLYAGKGLYDVAAFERSLAGRVPENSILSHDLFEGIHGRAGLVTDVRLLETHPSDVVSYMRRLHRWIRGDWQLLPWLGRRVPAEEGGRVPGRFTILDRWKILDNLRRSLMAPSLVALLLLGWTLPGGRGWPWTALAAAAVAFPTFLGAAAATRRLLGRRLGPWPRSGWQWRLLGRRARRRLGREAGRWLLALALLPYEAAVALDAIGRTLYRLFVSRRRRLEWTTAAQVARVGGAPPLSETLRRMAVGPIVGGGALAAVLVLRPASLPFAVPLIAGWVASPWIAHWLGLPAGPGEETLSPAGRRALRRVALRTWLYFERLVASEDHWLPPDNVQVDGEGRIARRTSPTNVGMMLTGTLAAFDLGFIGPIVLAAMARNTLRTLTGLERHRGHFLNWYSTRDLAPLEPRYVSTVDSGNLAASLLTLARGLEDVARVPLLRPEQAEGLRDTVDSLAGVLGDDGPGRSEAGRRLRDLLRDVARDLERAEVDPAALAACLAEAESRWLDGVEAAILAVLDEEGADVDRPSLRELRIWSRKLHHHTGILRRQLDTLLPWLDLLRRGPGTRDPDGGDAPGVEEARRALRRELEPLPSLADLPGRCEAAARRLSALEVGPGEAGREEPEEPGEAGEPGETVAGWRRALREALESARREGVRLLDELEEIRATADRLVEEMDFAFLFDPSRSLFHIGYHVTGEELDPHHYDLLASEARVASYLAVSRREAPVEHWLRLGRPFARVGGSRVLLSWGATLFEYLLPALFMRTPRPSLLDDACRRAIALQIAYGRSLGVPWGISESAYHQLDAQATYQYRAFGVPELGLRRDLGDRVVVAPYASVLALPFRPAAVVRNLRRLEEAGMLGPMGLFEALDYGVPRDAGNGRPAIVRAYMAHHQGMILGAIANRLCGASMVRRFHAEPRNAGIEYLLHERVPWRVPLRERWTEARRVRPAAAEGPPALRPWSVSGRPPHPRLHLLSNGRFTVFLTDDGGGGSVWGGRALTRWRPDPSRPGGGTWIYVQDLDTERLWSAGFEPTRAPPDESEVTFWGHLADLRRRDDGIATRMRVFVPPDEEIEVRRVVLSNTTDRRRRLRIVSYGEVVLAPPAEERRHPAYARLFVEAGLDPASGALLFRRRPRAADEDPIWLAHALVVRGEERPRIGRETDRRRFLGRDRTSLDPAALEDAGGLPEGEDPSSTLDPIFSLAWDVVLEPYASHEAVFLTAAGASRREALGRVERFRSFAHLDAAGEHARQRTEFALERLGIDPGELPTLQRLLSALVFPRPSLRTPPDGGETFGGREALWRHGLSGDDPILLLRVAALEDTADAARLVRAHAYWRRRGVPVDLVLLDGSASGYAQPLRDRLREVLEATGSGGWLGQSGGIHILAEDGLDAADRSLLPAAARVVLDASAGPIDDQLARREARPDRLPDFRPVPSAPPASEPTPPLERPDSLRFDNGFGGFTEDGREYLIFREPDRPTPAPWVNVLSNPDFGCLVSETGLGCTWAANSGENRLTPWRNDPVSNEPAEALYLRDEETAEVWSPTPLPAGAPAPCEVRHGAGYSVFRHHSHGLFQELRVFCPPDASLKVARLRLSNRRRRGRRITATYYAEWVLGPSREASAPRLVPSYDAESGTLLARNPFRNPAFAGRVAFLGADRRPHGVTADRREFLGEGGPARPDGLTRIGLSGSVRPGVDPCAAYQVHLDLAPGETAEVHFFLGEGADEAEARDLLRRFREPAAVEEAWAGLHRRWDDLLDRIQVRTPEPAMDLLVNRWLPYQALACRLWARTALYQSSGAFGFRDQLQDVMAFLDTAPGIARRHILEAAGRQFEEGDVLHWWQPHDGTGVRTRCSDDLLWLPWVTAAYVRRTGDAGVLEEEVPFLSAPPLRAAEEERYGRFEPGEGSGTLLEHCLRALAKGDTAGPHGLPLIGSGDWNDGMNRVGIRGRGESVWLGWFLAATLRAFAPLCEGRGDGDRASRLRRRAREIAARVEEAGWDGEWYRRAYFDDGTPLGSARNAECRIDAISQAWAVLSGAADPGRAARAMEAVARHLIDEEDRLVLLLAPPFDHTPRDPGYIKGYPPGVRENGGQYTHAGTWAGWAFARLNDTEAAARVFRYLAPVLRSSTPEDAERYRAEPYAVAADVYGAPPHAGRAGWTWYTGSAAWLYRFAVEGILGLRREGSRLRVEPRPPPGWAGYEVVLRFDDTRYAVRVEATGEGPPHRVELSVDGKEIQGTSLPLELDGGEHEVVVRLEGGHPTGR